MNVNACLDFFLKQSFSQLGHRIIINNDLCYDKVLHKTRNVLSMLRYVSYLIVFLYVVLVDPIAFASSYNMPYGVSPISHEIYRLHMAVFYVGCVIAICVFSVLFFSLINYRKSKGVKPAAFHANLTVEIIWTTIPFLILIGLAIPATIVLAHIHNTDESTLTIKITGYQWKWKYEYLNTHIQFFSFLSTPLEQIYGNAPKNKWYLLEVDNPVVVPVNTKVKLLITSDDVVHSWWVPDLGIKQDAVPGFINENWIYVTQPGEYRGQCGELCGVNHAFMPIVVKAVSQADFTQWMAKQQTAMTQNQIANLKTLPESDLLSLGKINYEKNCAMCHQNNGQGLSSTFPRLKNSRVVTAPLDETVAYILHGVPGTSMQAFGKILDDTSLAAIITYIRQAWGNYSINESKQQATVAQPQDIQRMRQILQIKNSAVK